MNRDYWTIYDDEAMEFEEELNREEEIIRELGLDSVMRQVIKRLNGFGHEESIEIDHFEEQSDLFEV